jgi:hypothetical protein
MAAKPMESPPTVARMPLNLIAKSESTTGSAALYTNGFASEPRPKMMRLSQSGIGRAIAVVMT